MSQAPRGWSVQWVLFICISGDFKLKSIRATNDEKWHYPKVEKKIQKMYAKINSHQSVMEVREIGHDLNS